MVAIEDVYGQIARFAQERGVQRVMLFGSRARGDNTPKSDIDIAVEGCRDFPGFLYDVQERLWSLLEIDAIDLDQQIAPELRESIARDGKVIYEAI